ncbi:hypothetical protein GCM10008957_54760 [Deinococcus ruber]|uniref:Uncharacterized protein n=1 Tax=Deinococcus ruber TaxID=1848197 RepID=A0A918FHY3_9DEIO|nr:hypothetical protein GCM10008957_54760 [Deinococcus ruber]
MVRSMINLTRPNPAVRDALNPGRASKACALIAIVESVILRCATIVAANTFWHA